MMPESDDQQDHGGPCAQDWKPDAGVAEPGRPGPFHLEDLLVLLRPEPPELMFHTEIVAGTGKVVDFERVSYLMDQELLASAKKAMLDEQTLRPRWDARYGTQWVWEEYCERHLEKYDEYFEPDVNPGWDS